MTQVVSRYSRVLVWVCAVAAFGVAVQAKIPASAKATAGQAVVRYAQAPAAQAPGTRPAQVTGTPGDIKSYEAVVQRYCVTCHNDRAKTANLSWQGVDLSNAAGDPDVGVKLEKMVRKLRAGAMPPQGMPRPDAAAMEAFVTTLENSLDRAAATHPNVGRTETFHRLNRAEYQNALRDVLALDIDVSNLVPQDESSFGFDNIAGVLKLSTTFVERYASAATKIARLAVGSPDIPSGEVATLLTSDLNQDRHIENLPLGTRGGVLIHHWVPLNADYEFTIELLRNGDDGSPSPDAFEDAHTIELSVDGERKFVYTYPTKPKGTGGRREIGRAHV